MAYPDFTANILSNSDNLKEGGVFDPLRSEVEILVVYDELQGTDEYPTHSIDVVKDLNSQQFRIYIGVPFKIPAGTNSRANFLQDYPVHELGSDNSQCSTATNRLRGFPVETVRANREAKNIWRIKIGLVMFVRQTINVEMGVTGRKRGVQVWKEPPIENQGGGLTLPALDWVSEDGMWADLIDCDASSEADQTATVSGDRNVDLNGEPLSKSVAQAALTVSFVLRAPYIKDEYDDDLTTDPSWLHWTTTAMKLLESRNIQEIFGSQNGTVMLENISITPLGILEYQRCDLTFVKDDWNHFVQQPLTFFGATTGLVPRCAQPDEGEDATLAQKVFGTENVLWLNPFIYGFNTTADIYDYLPCGAGDHLDAWDWDYETP